MQTAQMARPIEYDDVYAVTFALKKSERDGESRLTIGTVQQGGPAVIRFNFKYLPDLIGATIDDSHQFLAET